MRLRYKTDQWGGTAYCQGYTVTQCLVYSSSYGLMIGWNCHYAFHRRGFTKRLVKRVLKHHNEMVCYIRTNNVPSLNLAISLGFRPFEVRGDTMYLRWTKKEKT